MSKLINESLKENNVINTKNIKVQSASDYIDLLPKKTEIIDSLKKVRKQAYLDAGLLYKDKFLNQEMSANRLLKLLKLNPTQNQEILALYNLYKLQRN